MKYYATKKGSFRIHNRKDFETELNALPESRYTVEVKKYRKNKSQEQLGYYFSCVLPMFLSAAVAQGWELTTIEECDAWLKSMFAERDLINRNTAEIVKIPALKRNMTLRISWFLWIRYETTALNIWEFIFLNRKNKQK